MIQQLRNLNYLLLFLLSSIAISHESSPATPGTPGYPKTNAQLEQTLSDLKANRLAAEEELRKAKEANPPDQAKINEAKAKLAAIDKNIIEAQNGLNSLSNQEAAMKGQDPGGHSGEGKQEGKSGGPPPSPPSPPPGGGEGSGGEESPQASALPTAKEPEDPMKDSAKDDKSKSESDALYEKMAADAEKQKEETEKAKAVEKASFEQELAKINENGKKAKEQLALENEQKLKATQNEGLTHENGQTPVRKAPETNGDKLMGVESKRNQDFMGPEFTPQGTPTYKTDGAETQELDLADGEGDAAPRKAMANRGVKALNKTMQSTQKSVFEISETQPASLEIITDLKAHCGSSPGCSTR